MLTIVHLEYLLATTKPTKSYYRSILTPLAIPSLPFGNHYIHTSIS